MLYLLFLAKQVGPGSPPFAIIACGYWFCVHGRYALERTEAVVANDNARLTEYTLHAA